MNCIRDFEENGHFNDRQWSICFSLPEIEVTWIFLKWLDV